MGKESAKKMLHVERHKETFNAIASEFKARQNIKYREETFEEAMQRQGLSDSDLKDAHKYQYNMFKFWATLGAFDLIAMAYTLIKGDYMATIPTVIFIGLAGSICLQASYKSYSINKRQLGVVDKWKKSGEWFPKPFKAKSQSKSMVQS